MSALSLAALDNEAPLAGRRVNAHVLAFPVFALLFLTAAFLYHQTFRNYGNLQDLYVEQYTHGSTQVGTHRFWYTLDNDSILYESLFENGVDWQYAIFNYPMMPNVMGISILAQVATGLGLGIFHLNLVLILLSGFFLTLIGAKLRLSPTLPLACIFLNPVTIFFCQSATKEVPLIFGCTLLVLLYVHLRWELFLLAVLPVIVGVGVIRAQTGAILGFAVTLSLLNFRKSRLILLLFFLAVFALFPLTSLTGYWEGAEGYRENSGRVGIGEMIDFGLKYVPMAGVVCFPLRALQNALDPFPFAPLLQDGKSIWNMYACLYQGAFFFTSFVFVNVLPLIWSYLRGKAKLTRHEHGLLLLIVLGWFSVVIVPYVQGRYLYPFLPVAAFALSFAVQYQSRSLRIVSFFAWLGVACLQTWTALAVIL